MLSIVAALVFQAALSVAGIVVLRQLAPYLTRLEYGSYGAVLGAVIGSVLVLGLAGPIGLLPAVIAVTLFSAAGAWLYWPSGTALAPGGWLGAAARARDRLGIWPAVVIGLFVGRLALLWASALSVEADGLWAGHLYIWSDWTVHLGDTTAFAYADNFPPTHPRLAGAPLAYHYLISVSAAGMVALGMDPLVALPLQSFAFSVVLVVALYAFALRLSADRGVATLSLVLFMLGGSLGWLLLFDPAGGGPIQALLTNPWDQGAQKDANFWWLNPYFAQIMPQRATLFGIPLVLLVLTLVLAAARDRSWFTFATAGVVAGFLPIAHLGSLAALGLIAPFLVLVFPQRGWLAFFGAWAIIGGAFMFGVQGGDVGTSSELRWEPGWLAEDEPWAWFWMKNLGLFLPLGVVGLFVRDLMPRPSMRMLLAFMPIFVVANTFILSVVKWDNSKVIVYWFLALAILAAAVVVRLWRTQRDPLTRGFLVVAVATMVASGLLTNLHQLKGLDRTRLATPEGLALADAVMAETPADAIFAVGLEHNHPVPMLTGRRVIMSYAPWLRSHGLDPSRQEADLRAIYRLDDNAADLIEGYGVDYVVIGAWEIEELEANVEGFTARYPIVIEEGAYRVFAVSDEAISSH